MEHKLLRGIWKFLADPDKQNEFHLQDLQGIAVFLAGLCIPCQLGLQEWRSVVKGQQLVNAKRSTRTGKTDKSDFEKVFL